MLSMFILFFLSCNDAEEPPSTKIVNASDPVNQLEFRKDIKPKALTINNLENLPLNLPQKTNKEIFTAPLTTPQKQTVKIIKNVLEKFALQGDDPWAIAHALLALGKTTKVMDGSDAVDAIFKYADIQNIYGHAFPEFPREITQKNSVTPVEPHKDLIMKVLIEVGIPPDRVIKIDENDFTVGDYYKGSILRSYLNPQTNDSSYHSPNDMAWSVQGITSIVHPKQTWMSASGMMTSSDFLAQFIVAVLAQETVSLKKSMAAGANFKKDKTGIFKYTCGGAHLLQAAAYATARGFGNEKTKEEILEQIDLHFYRFPRELKIYDRLLKSNPEYKIRLLAQRLKYVGHFLETAQKLSMLNLYRPNQEQILMMQGAMDQLVLTIRALHQDGAFQNLYNFKVNDPQLYRDIIGDSAHALYAMYLFSGNRYVTY